ncbi:MAG: hypothetical protein J6K14_07860 [Clostridia bacterium]|nr:hypothetical protein [Clostridia bacterium]
MFVISNELIEKIQGAIVPTELAHAASASTSGCFGCSGACASGCDSRCDGSCYGHSR